MEKLVINNPVIETTRRWEKHFLDKPILRHFFWVIVMPYNLKKWIEEHKTTNKED